MISEPETMWQNTNTAYDYIARAAFWPQDAA